MDVHLIEFRDWGAIQLFLYKNIKDFVKNYQRFTWKRLWQSRTARLFILALVTSEIVGLIAAVYAAYVGFSIIGATSAGYFSVTASFYGFTWPAARIIANPRKWLWFWLFFGDIPFFVGIGAVADRAAGVLQCTLGNLFSYVCCDSVSMLLATIIQSIIYIPLVTIACYPRLITKKIAD